MDVIGELARRLGLSNKDKAIETTARALSATLAAGSGAAVNAPRVGAEAPQTQAPVEQVLDKLPAPDMPVIAPEVEVAGAQAEPEGAADASATRKENSKIKILGEVAKNKDTGSEFSGGKHDDAEIGVKMRHGRDDDWIKLVDKFLPGKKVGTDFMPTFQGFEFEGVNYTGSPIYLDGNSQGRQVIIKYGKRMNDDEFSILLSEAEDVPEIRTNRVFMKDLSAEDLDTFEDQLAVVVGTLVSWEGGYSPFASQTPTEVSDLRKSADKTTPEPASKKSALAIEIL